MRRPRWGRTGSRRRRAPWLLALLPLGLAAGATAVAAATGVFGSAGIVTGQAIVSDTSLFTDKDVKKAIDDKVVTFNDDGTGLLVAGEFHVGEEFVLDVPLANTSDADANAIATLDAPGLLKEIELVWKTRSRSTTPTSTTTTPSPVPLTGVTPQSSDTSPATSAPSGTAGINPQVSDTTGTTSSPGLPSSTPQPQDGASTNAKPTGVQDNTAQQDAPSATNTAPSGSTAVESQTANGATNTSQPGGLSGVGASRTASFTATTAAPSGAPSISAQSVTPSAAGSQPSGAPASSTSKWWTGTFTVDIDADGTNETVNFVLTDASGDGDADTMDLSTDDATFGETTGGPLSGQSPRQTGPDDDERITGTTDIRLGPFYTFTVTFASDGSSASITSKTWFTSTVTTTDLDGDGTADDTFHALLTDVDSDGVYEKLDLSIGDQVFGETGAGSLTDGEVDYDASDNTNDERLAAASETSSGSHNVAMGVNTFTFTWDTTPGGGA